jgi:hypothetical protein
MTQNKVPASRNLHVQVRRIFTLLVCMQFIGLASAESIVLRAGQLIDGYSARPRSDAVIRSPTFRNWSGWYL